MNSTIVLNRLTAARAEGGNAHAITAATALVNQYYPGRTFDVETTVNAVFNAIDRFDAPGAETAINEALAALSQPVAPAAAAPATAADDHEDTTHEARISALETVARNNGLGHLLPGAGDTHEARITALEGAARSRGLL